MDSLSGFRLLMFSLIVCAFSLQADDDDANRTAMVIVQPVILSKQAQDMSGVKTLIVHEAAYAEEFETMGKVVSIEPLLTLRSRYRVALAELKSATARFEQVKLSLHRQQKLFQDGISPKRSLQELTTQQFTEQAMVDSARVRLAELSSNARLQWGAQLSEWVTAGDASSFKHYLTGRHALLQITLPGDRQYSATQGNILIEPYGIRERARPARYLSRTSQIENGLSGESYFFVCDGDNLRAGMKLTAWLKQPADEATGVMLPQSAVIWYMGQTFVYVKTGKAQFDRRALPQLTPAGEHYFIEKSLQDGDEVVSVGGQMLLSEEMRQHIPDED